MPAEEVPEQAITFHEFASDWYDERRAEWAPATQAAYLAELRDHLLPFFADFRLGEIDVAAVDQYRAFKLSEARIGPAYINTTIAKLGTILDLALERELIERNPVRVNPRARRVRRVRKARPIYLDRAEQITALLDGAGAIDQAARKDRRTFNRRVFLATLIFGGPRVEEALTMRWRDVDLANGRLLIAGTKTNAADREFQMLPALKQELVAHKQTAPFSAPDDLVFCTETGRQQSRSNTLSRVLKPAIRLANVELVANGFVPIPVDRGRGKSLSQHGLRHTHISLRCALGEDDIATIARDVGHRDPAMTLRIYTHVMDLDQASRERLAKLVNCGLKRHVKARSPSQPTAEHGENPYGHGWFRTSDLSRVKRALSR